jgi:hypothetical protein
MSRISVRLVLLVTILAAVAEGNAGPLWAAAPIAHYPMQTDGLDATGINGPLILENAPFQDGGVYCNGIYGGFIVQTPRLPDLNFNTLAVSVEFRIDDYPGPSDDRRPILIGGYDYRWIGAEMSGDGTIGMLYNNMSYEVGSTIISLGVWHKIVITYDSSTRIGSLYLDDLLAASATFDLVYGEDSEFMAYNPSTGHAFKGLLRELVVYDAAYDPTPVEGTSWGTVRALYR